MGTMTEISPRLEDYLETILHLVAEHQVARVSDIAARMGVQMPTVTGALKHLTEHGLVNYEPYQFVTLTPDGIAIARGTVRRHDILKKFLMDVLALPEETAKHDACGMEHALSEETLGQLLRFVRFAETCPRIGRSLITNLQSACGADDAVERPCRPCIEKCLGQLPESEADE